MRGKVGIALTVTVIEFIEMTLEKQEKVPFNDMFVELQSYQPFSETSVLSTMSNNSFSRQVCAALTEARNLTKVEPPKIGWLV